MNSTAYPPKYEELKISEIRYRRLFESAKDGILILDFESGEIIDANPFIVKIIGFPIEEILGKKLWEIGLFSNKEQSEKAFIELKKNNYIRFEDMPILRRNGTITDVEFVSNVYLENNIKVIQCNIRDITERINAENALRESEKNLKKQNSDFFNLNKEYEELNKELTESLLCINDMNIELYNSKIKAEESDKLKSAFLANMSHEIRTPINAIIGFADLLLEPTLTTEKLEKFVRIINSNSQQLLSVISDILDISKIEAGQIIINSESVNITKLLSELFVTYKKLVGYKNFSLRYSCYPSNQNIQVKTDGNRIKQVLCNLLNNAIKFTKAGEIEFGYKINGEYIEFFVKDSGIGISREDHALIFQRFRQIETNNSEIYSGNGLGLSISKALVEKLGGTITVSSEPGNGSVFVFTIPYIRDYENIDTSIIESKSSQYLWKSKTILLVEDEISNHSYFEELLSATKVKLLHAWDGKEAVENVKKHPDISLVLMDIKMPLMTGYEATRLIKKIRPKLPVIAQTAYALDQDRELSINSGCDNYLAKPTEKELFLNVINSYLN